MTIQYYHEVLTVGPTTFLKLLTKWRGSVIKLIYKDAIIFTVLYVSVACLHRYVLNGSHKKTFEGVVTYVYQLQSKNNHIALVLGFYVAIVFGRLWRHFNTVPWITKIAMLLSSHLNAGSGEDEKKEAQLQKRSIIRYLVASEIMTLSRVSVPVKRRFPNMIDLYNKGILLEHEVTLIMETHPMTLQPFLPISWCTSIIMKAFEQGRITNDLLLVDMIKEINKFRHLLQELFLLDHICIPLVYTQVVTIAIYTYFATCIVGRQFTEVGIKDKISEDFIVPIFTIIEFIVYMGWLKLALTLVNPMGEDDEDFDLNTVVDYNFEVGMAIINQLNSNQPSFTQDKFFNQPKFELPMESELRDSKAMPFMGSVYNLKVDENNGDWVTSLQSIVTINSDTIDRHLSGGIGSLHSLHLMEMDGHIKAPTRSGSSKSAHKHHPLRRQVSTASSFISNIIAPITEEENIDLNDLETFLDSYKSNKDNMTTSEAHSSAEDHEQDTATEVQDIGRSEQNKINQSDDL